MKTYQYRNEFSKKSKFFDCRGYLGEYTKIHGVTFVCFHCQEINGKKVKNPRSEKNTLFLTPTEISRLELVTDVEQKQVHSDAMLKMVRGT